MLDLGCWVWVAGFKCWIWAAGWGVRPRATRIEGTSEQPGSWCRAAMHGAGRVWEDLRTRRFHCCLPLPAVGTLSLASAHS